MIVNKQFAGMLGQSIMDCMTYNKPTIVLCSGTIPDDATWNTVGTTTITTSGSFIYNQTIATITLTESGFSLLDTVATPPLWYLNSNTAYTVSAAKAGTIGWAVVYYPSVYILAMDVSLPNQGGVIQLDKTNVSVGDLITIMGLTVSIWR